MSSILKALKKLEEDQARQSTATSAGSGGQFVPSQRTGRWRALLLIGCGVGVGLLLAGAAFLFSGHQELARVAMPEPAPDRKTAVAPRGELPISAPVESSPRIISQPEKPAQMTVRKKPPAAFVSPASPTVDPKPPATILPPVPAAGSALKAPPVRTATVSPAPQNNPSLPAVTTSAGSAVAAPQEPAPAAEPVKQVRVDRVEIPRPGQQWAAPHLTVSEIIPASGGERMAIVNGLPVMAGTVVEDALVKEIHPDRVVFDIAGKIVVVPLRVSQ
jgi:hypothetical protein